MTAHVLAILPGADTAALMALIARLRDQGPAILLVVEHDAVCPVGSDTEDYARCVCREVWVRYLVREWTITWRRGL